MTPPPESALEFVRRLEAQAETMAEWIASEAEDCDNDKWSDDDPVPCAVHEERVNILRALAAHLPEIVRALEVAEAVAWCEANRKISAQVQMRGSWDWIALAWPNVMSRSVMATGPSLPAAVQALRARLGEGSA